MCLNYLTYRLLYKRDIMYMVRVTNTKQIKKMFPDLDNETLKDYQTGINNYDWQRFFVLENAVNQLRDSYPILHGDMKCIWTIYIKK